MESMRCSGSLPPFWGARLGMKSTDFFREGAGINERTELGDMIFADFYPCPEGRKGIFRDFECVMDRNEGLVSLTGSCMGGRSLYERVLLEKTLEYGEPHISSESRKRRLSAWNVDGNTVLLEELSETDDLTKLRLHVVSEKFPEMWMKMKRPDRPAS